MKDRDETALLTKLGYLFLKNVGCHAVSTEVKVPWFLIPNIDASDVYVKNRRHTLIDIIGIEDEYLPPSKQYVEKVEIFGKTIPKKIVKKPILRGIEVKVSRSDFKNGFIHIGCHYNYLMIPKGLVSPKEVDKNVGIIEVDLKNWGIKKHTPPFYGYSLIGIELIRKPKRQAVAEKACESVFNQIPRSLTHQVKHWLVQELSKD